MRLKILLFFSVIISCSFNQKTQLYETIESRAADLLISLSIKDSSYKFEIENLKSSLYQNVNSEVLEKTYLTSLNEYDSLRDHFSEFEKEINKISLDSALVLFNQWYLHFNSVFYNYAEKKFFSSQKIKILLFSTSMSCYCTLEMCKNQLIDILKLVRSSNSEYDYLAIDAYAKDDLPIKYETLFTPSVIVFNGNNEVIHKIAYDEEMINKLSVFLNEYKN